MTDRADYIRGLRTLANLLADHDDLALPFDGTTDFVSIYAYGETALAQALACIPHMDPSPTVEIQLGETPRLKVAGRIAGVRFEVSMRTNEVCERRVTDVYRDGNGTLHEVAEWVIPAELLAAAGGDSRG